MGGKWRLEREIVGRRGLIVHRFSQKAGGSMIVEDERRRRG